MTIYRPRKQARAALGVVEARIVHAGEPGGALVADLEEHGERVPDKTPRKHFFFFRRTERNVRIPWGKPTSYEHVNKYNWKNVVR